jgi:2-methylisocitrate lyase-like PEP mutase family enzyme
MTASQKRFRDLHREGCFVMPNPYDVGSTRLLTSLGFPALATTSGGFAASLGRADMTLDLDAVLPHVHAVVAATDLPVNVDSERCFADSAEGVAETVRILADAGAAGCSIEDWDPSTGQIDSLEVSVDRVAAAAAAAAESGILLTARCEGVLRNVTALDETITRLEAFRDAGADVLYAPGLTDLDDIRRLVARVDAPVNVLLMPGGPRVDELAAAGVRRISTGSRLASVAYGALVDAATFLLRDGQVDPALQTLDRNLAQQSFI